jgi:pyruvate/2-oxoglutarate dehydrogenase complex dihydrolipoamide acyltransferase (E2) component
VHIGVAVDTPRGLIVPVVRDVDKKSLAQVARELNDVAERTRQAKFDIAELRGGTFTVTSAGRAGGLLVTPLINSPEVAILGVHRIEERPVVRGGEVVVRQVGNLSVTFDHRVIDGKRAADFGLAVIARLQKS